MSAVLIGYSACELTRLAFEAHIQKECRNDYERNLVVQRFDSKPEEYRLEQVQSRWKTWQAATEAAKATGTAGELPEPDVHDAAGYRRAYSAEKVREYGQACAEAVHRDWLELQKTEQRLQEAARQPAPVVAVKTWQERMFDNAEAGNRTGSPQRFMRQEITDLRAALAATNRSQP